MSKKKHILVEGKWDKIAMTFLLSEMTRVAGIGTEDISIETAEQIIASEGKKIGN
jgi:5S rRNA maturation endonuclease (ribonuclease M5)